MARTSRLRYGRSTDLEPCIICARIAWLSERLRVFYLHIARAEQTLRAAWTRANPVLLGEAEDAQARQERWDRAMPGVAKRLGGNPVAVAAIRGKTTQLKQDARACRALARAESRKYVAAHIPFPVHVRWHQRLTGVLFVWGQEHPMCLGVDGSSLCGLRTGGHHWCVVDEHGLCSLCATERARGGPVQIKGRGWIEDEIETDEITEETENGN